jgi:ribosomal protein S27AE
MKGRIFHYAKYKAYNEGIITSRVNPGNTSRECARCGAEVARYAAGQAAEGYTPGAPLVLCPKCGMRGHADRNASLVIGKRLVARYQTPQEEKPPAPLPAERESKDSGVEDSHEPKTEAVGHSSLSERHGILNEHGTAQERTGMDGCSLSDMPPTLRRSPSWGPVYSGQRLQRRVRSCRALALAECHEMHQPLLYFRK